MFNYPLQNIANIGKDIYLFNRQSDGSLDIQKDVLFLPYFYQSNPNGIFLGYFGGKFNKMFKKLPWQIKNVRDVKVDGESDIIYTKRYLLDKVNIIKSRTKWIMFDIETQSKIIPNPLVAPDPITSITVYDNYSQQYKQFWTLNYKTEYDLLNAFINYINEIKPDLLIAYNVDGFDMPYLVTRFPDFSEKISPINKKNYHNQYPEGISVVDYYQFIKKVYKYKRNTLDYIYSEEFKVPQNSVKYRFDIISDIIKEKNLEDVKKMVALENKLHIIDYFDEQRRLAKVLWEDLCHFSVSIDGLILQESKKKGVVLPSKPEEEERLRRKEEDKIHGGWVFSIPGRYEGVTLLDVSGTYPSLISTFNLDPVNIRKESSTQTVKIRKINIYQNPDAIVPTVSRKLIYAREQIQKELLNKTGLEFDLLKKKDEAHKSLNNTLYGILLFKNSRIYNKDIADTITYLARFLIRYIKFSLNKLGFKVVAADTDSNFIHSKDFEKIENLCNNILIPKWLKHFGKTEGKLKFKYEGYFENVVFTGDKHYKGNFVKANGEKKVIDKGIEIVRRDSSKYQETFLEDLYNKILKGDNENECSNWIKQQINEFKNHPLKNIAAPFQRNETVYDSEPVFIRALKYTDEILPNFSKEYHNDLYYIYVKSMGKAERKSSRMLKNKETGKRERKESNTLIDKNVLVFEGDDTSHIKEVDWDKMIEKNIIKKVKIIYTALKWDFSIFVPKKEKKPRKKKEKTITEFAKEEVANNAEERAIEILDNKEAKIKKNNKSISDSLSL